MNRTTKPLLSWKRTRGEEEAKRRKETDEKIARTDVCYAEIPNRVM